jgi:hypothetical protein
MSPRRLTAALREELDRLNRLDDFPNRRRLSTERRVELFDPRVARRLATAAAKRHEIPIPVANAAVVYQVRAEILSEPTLARGASEDELSSVLVVAVNLFILRARTPLDRTIPLPSGGSVIQPADERVASDSLKALRLARKHLEKTRARAQAAGARVIEVLETESFWENVAAEHEAGTFP